MNFGRHFMQFDANSFRQMLMDLPVTESAPRLLGAVIEMGHAAIQIVEIEAYGGAEDPGSHAYRGVTPRTRGMFETTGHAYVYFTYGNHWMLNVTARPFGEPGALLIRAAIPLRGEERLWPNRPKARRPQDLLSGPGKIAAALGLGRGHDGLDLLSVDSPLRLIPAAEAVPILIGTRIGIAPGKGDEMVRRYVDGSKLEWVSARRTGLVPL